MFEIAADIPLGANAHPIRQPEKEFLEYNDKFRWQPFENFERVMSFD
jgi:hypothetical protein